MPALADLSPLLLALVIIGFAVLLYGLILAIQDLTKALPIVGPWVTKNVDAINQKILHAMGAALSGVDSFIGGTFHQLARFLDRVWGELPAAARVALELATGFAALIPIVQAIRALVHRLEHTSSAHHSQIKHLERELRGIGNDVTALQKEYHGIDELHLHKQLTKIHRELDHIENDIAIPLRDGQTTAGAAIDNLYEWAKGKAALIGVGTFAMAVAAAVGANAWRMIRCSAFGNLWKSRGCGFWSLLDGLLGLVISALALENVCRLLPILESAFGDVVGPIVHLLTEVPLGDCEKPPESWAQLSVAHGPLPPRQTLGALPT